MGGWMYGCMDVWMDHGCMYDGWMDDGWMMDDVCMYGLMDVCWWMDGWMDGWMLDG